VGDSGEECSTVYDFSEACAKCGTGAFVKDMLKVKLGFSPKHFFETLADDYLISEELHTKITAQDLNIGPLKKVSNKKGQLLPYYHLATRKILPPADVVSGLKIDEQCPACKRNGYFNDVIIGSLEKGIPTVVLPLVLTYQKDKIAEYGISDIFFSWECIGLSSKRDNPDGIKRYARPMLIVSERLKIVLEDEAKRDIEFSDINFI